MHSYRSLLLSLLLPLMTILASPFAAAAQSGPCGRLNETCCAGGRCQDPNDLCSQGICRRCGERGGPCCINGEPCHVSADACSNGLCLQCGLSNSPCCQGAGSACFADADQCTDGICLRCGEIGSVCCRSGIPCPANGATCRDGMCRSLF